MKVTLERLPESRVQLEIEVDQDRFDKSLEAAFRRLAPKTRVPGFRPGKAPRPLVERQLGRSRLVEEALDKLVPDVYNEALESEDVDAIDQPELSKVELDPVRLQFVVSVRPTVDLGDYRSIRVEKTPVEVTDEMVEEQVLLLRRRNALHVPVERPAQWNDVLLADVVGVLPAPPAEPAAAADSADDADEPDEAEDAGESDEDETFIRDEDAEFALREGQLLLVPGLAEAIIGMSKGEEKAIELPIPEDFRVERLQGKDVVFTVTIKEVKEEQLPDEDDELAAQVNAEEFPTFEALRSQIREDLEKSLQTEEDNRVRNDVLDKLVEGATIDFPAVMVERGIDHIVQDMTGNDRAQYTSYLQRVGRSEAEYRATLREAAEARVRRALALAHLADAEKIDPDTAAVEAELDRIIEPMGEQAEQFRQMFSTADGIASIRRNLMSQQTLDRLLAIAAGEEPPLPQADEEEPEMPLGVAAIEDEALDGDPATVPTEADADGGDAAPKEEVPE